MENDQPPTNHMTFGELIISRSYEMGHKIEKPIYEPNQTLEKEYLQKSMDVLSEYILNEDKSGLINGIQDIFKVLGNNLNFNFSLSEKFLDFVVLAFLSRDEKIIINVVQLLDTLIRSYNDSFENLLSEEYVQQYFVLIDIFQPEGQQFLIQFVLNLFSINRDTSLIAFRYFDQMSKIILDHISNIECNDILVYIESTLRFNFESPHLDISMILSIFDACLAYKNYEQCVDRVLQLLTLIICFQNENINDFVINHNVFSIVCQIFINTSNISTKILSLNYINRLINNNYQPNPDEYTYLTDVFHQAWSSPVDDIVNGYLLIAISLSQVDIGCSFLLSIGCFDNILAVLNEDVSFSIKKNSTQLLINIIMNSNQLCLTDDTIQQIMVHMDEIFDNEIFPVDQIDIVKNLLGIN